MLEPNAGYLAARRRLAPSSGAPARGESPAHSASLHAWIMGLRASAVDLGVIVSGLDPAGRARGACVQSRS